MSVTNTVEDFLAQLEELPELKAFPAAATRLLAECDDPDLTPNRIAEIIRCDPAIAGHLLQIANSPLYGYSGKIRTIEQAVVVLGMKSIRNITLTMAGAAVFSDGEVAMAERQSLWRHSLAVATVGRVLAPLCNAPPEEAFLAGIFHDVGKLVIYDLAAEVYCGHDPTLPADQRVELESQTFGIDHAELGMDCADDWGLPTEIAEAIGHHHSHDEANGLVGCTAVSNAFVNEWRLDAPQHDSMEPKIEPTLVVAERAGLPINEDQALELRESAVGQYEEVLRTLS